MPVYGPGEIRSLSKVLGIRPNTEITRVLKSSSPNPNPRPPPFLSASPSSLHLRLAITLRSCPPPLPFRSPFLSLPSTNQPFPLLSLSLRTDHLPVRHTLSRFQISTLATKLGVRNIALLGTGLLLANYVVAISVAFYTPQVSIIIPEYHKFVSTGILMQCTKPAKYQAIIWHATRYRYRYSSYKPTCYMFFRHLGGE